MDHDHRGGQSYENFFVCNYGVGGNVPGQPVFDCGGQKEQEEEEDNMAGAFRTLNVGFVSNLPRADADARDDIGRCLAAIACLEQQGQVDCGDALSTCLPPDDLGPSSSSSSLNRQEMVRLAECQIEFILCRLSDVDSCRGQRGRCLSSVDGETEVVTPAFGTTTEVPLQAPDYYDDDDGGKVDLRYYGASRRDPARLALCAEAAECEPDGGDPDASHRCGRAQVGCAAGLDVSGLPAPVRRKLSECHVDDLLCHLSGEGGGTCRDRFAACVDIVIPDGLSVPAADPAADPVAEVASEDTSET